jgi:hypothetical protein
MSLIFDELRRSGGQVNADNKDIINALITARNKKIDEKKEGTKYTLNEIMAIWNNLSEGERNNPNYVVGGTIGSGGAGGGGASNARGKIGSVSGKTYSNLTSNEILSLQQGLNDLIKDGLISADRVEEVGYITARTKTAVASLQSVLGTNPDGYWGPNTAAAFKKSHLSAYKTGGLADFTGPAWLDGTKSRPELVLNQQDTQNFLLLKDVLSGVLRNAPNQHQDSGDAYFDIDIHIDEISDDYDVDQMVERVKQDIYRDSMYRNVNTVNLFR